MATVVDVPNPQREKGRVMRGLSVQRRVLHALLLRELHTRYGRENIGFLWFIAEPLMLATVITIVHFGKHMAPKHGISVIPFTIIGYTIFIVFRGIFNRAEGAVDGNQPLLHHQMVSIFDFMVVKAVLELAACFTVMCLLIGLGIATGLAEWPYRPLHLIAAFLFMTWFSFALGLIAASMSYHNETLGRLMHPFSYFMIPLSGAWWMISWLAPPVQAYFRWWPMALIFEEARYGQFRQAPTTFLAPGYVAFCCAGLSYIGLLMVRRLRRRVHL